MTGLHLHDLPDAGRDGRAGDDPSMRTDVVLADARRRRAEFVGQKLRHALAPAITLLRGRITHWRETRRHRAEVDRLLELDPRVLNDIGLERADLEAVRVGVLPYTTVLGARRRRGDPGGDVVSLPERRSHERSPTHEMGRAA